MVALAQSSSELLHGLLDAAKTLSMDAIAAPLRNVSLNLTLPSLPQRAPAPHSMTRCNDPNAVPRAFRIVGLSLEDLLTMARERLDVLEAAHRPLWLAVLRTALKHRNLLLLSSAALALFYVLNSILAWYGAGAIRGKTKRACTVKRGN